MSTEANSPRFVDLDVWPSFDAIEAMIEGQMAAVAAVRPQSAALAAAVDAAAARLGQMGRLVYVGAGTSGRVAVQDGVELAPTYDWGDERIVFALAGGMSALMLSAEGAEDDAEAGRVAMREAKVGPCDVVIGVAASGNTPYTVAAIEEARTAGALTVGMACNASCALVRAAEHPIVLDTGSEVVAGSTRMKAGTAQKVALNVLSTAIMLRLGRVYRGLMVSMRPSNKKLHIRAAMMVSDIAGCSVPQAQTLLEQAGGKIKVAIVAAAQSVSVAEAAQILAGAQDNLRTALNSHTGG